MFKDYGIQKKQLIITIVFGFLPLMTAMVLILVYTIRVQDERYLNLSSSVAQSMDDTMNVNVSAMVDTSFYLIGDGSVRTFMMASGMDPQSQAYTDIYQNCLLTLSRFPFNAKSYQYIILETWDGRYMQRGTSSYDAFSRISEAEKQQANARNGQWFWTSNGEHLAICREIRDMYDISRCLGYVKIGLRKSQFERTFSQKGAGFYLLIADNAPVIGNLPCSLEELAEKNRVGVDLLTEESGVPRSVTVGNSKYLLSSGKLYDGHTIFIKLTEDHRDHRDSIFLFIAATVFITVLVVVMQTSYVHRYIIKPILKLAGMMNTIDTESRFDMRFRIQGNDEISVLADRFNQMADRLNILYNEVHRNELLIREAEIKSLQAEMRPHFLSNAINTIYWTLKAQRYDSAASMLTDLSNMFQYTLTKSPDGLAPLDQEIRHAEAYLRLQKSRMMENFTYSIDIDADRDHLTVMKFVLQPLIENAFKHGLSTVPWNGYLSISIFADESTLYYHVYDNGTSADAERIRKLLEPDNEAIEANGHGIALHNVNKRLKLKFGAQYGITFKQPGDGGIVFIVSQPLMTMEGGEQA